MDKKIRLYCLDGDTLSVSLVYSEEIGQYIPDYPDFNSNPRYTPSGKKWVNVTQIGCPFADQNYGDCGSCEHFMCEQPTDLIGVCCNDIFINDRKDA